MLTVPSIPAEFVLTVPAGQQQSNVQEVTFDIPVGQWLTVIWVSQGTSSGVVDVQQSSVVTGRDLNGSYDQSAVFTSGALVDSVNAAAGGPLSVSVRDVLSYVPDEAVVDEVHSYFLMLEGASPSGSGRQGMTANNVETPASDGPASLASLASEGSGDGGSGSGSGSSSSSGGGGSSSGNSSSSGSSSGSGSSTSDSFASLSASSISGFSSSGMSSGSSSSGSGRISGSSSSSGRSSGSRSSFSSSSSSGDGGSSSSSSGAGGSSSSSSGAGGGGGGTGTSSFSIPAPNMDYQAGQPSHFGQMKSVAFSSGKELLRLGTYRTTGYIVAVGQVDGVNYGNTVQSIRKITKDTPIIDTYNPPQQGAQSTGDINPHYGDVVATNHDENVETFYTDTKDPSYIYVPQPVIAPPSNQAYGLRTHTYGVGSGLLITSPACASMSALISDEQVVHPYGANFLAPVGNAPGVVDNTPSSDELRSNFVKRIKPTALLSHNSDLFAEQAKWYDYKGTDLSLVNDTTTSGGTVIHNGEIDHGPQYTWVSYPTPYTLSEDYPQTIVGPLPDRDTNARQCYLGGLSITRHNPNNDYRWKDSGNQGFPGSMVPSTPVALNLSTTHYGDVERRRKEIITGYSQGSAVYVTCTNVYTCVQSQVIAGYNVGDPQYACGPYDDFGLDIVSKSFIYNCAQGYSNDPQPCANANNSPSYTVTTTEQGLRTVSAEYAGYKDEYASQITFAVPVGQGNETAQYLGAFYRTWGPDPSDSGCPGQYTIENGKVYEYSYLHGWQPLLYDGSHPRYVYQHAIEDSRANPEVPNSKVGMITGCTPPITIAPDELVLLGQFSGGGNIYAATPSNGDNTNGIITICNPDHSLNDVSVWHGGKQVFVSCEPYQPTEFRMVIEQYHTQADGYVGTGPNGENGIAANNVQTHIDYLPPPKQLYYIYYELPDPLPAMGDGPLPCDSVALPLPTDPALNLAGMGGVAGTPSMGNAPLTTGALQVGPAWGTFPDYGSPQMMDFGMPPSTCDPGGGSCGMPTP